MRLGLIIYGSLDTLSGGYLYDRKLVDYLRAQGDTVEIISLPWRNDLKHLADNLSPALRWRLGGLEVDVLLQDELNHLSLVWLNPRLRSRVSYPIVSIVHHLRSSEARPAWQNLLSRWLERAYLASVDGFICNSQTTWATVRALLRAERPRVVAYPAGDHLATPIQDEDIFQRALQPGPLRLLFVGNLIPRKGLHTLLRALRSVPFHTWKLTVVGRLDLDRSYTHRLLRLVQRWQIQPQVHFTGPLDEAGLRQKMANSQVLVLPSSYEGFGIACLEGMGFGLVPLASGRGGLSELITSGEDGFLIPPEDQERLRATLISLYHDRSRLARLSLAARWRYLAHPTWEQSAARIRSFLMEQIRTP
jgi:glycosyltransferase involved in cell wall biosynthesis